jgi:6-phosphogluconolactonase
MTGIPDAKWEVLDDPEALAIRVADWLLARAAATRDVFTVALSGGSTPRRIYELLGDPPRQQSFPWSRTHWFWGDERFVSRSDARSNYQMAWQAMLSRAPVPPRNIHPMPVEAGDPEAAALAYEKELKSFYGSDSIDPSRPVLDVTFLGLGDNGHTASLFPGTAALEERQRWVVAVRGVAPEPRLTLTYPVIESSRQVAFLVTGSEKRTVLARFRRGDSDLPAARLKPSGELWIFADLAAAAESVR